MTKLSCIGLSIAARIVATCTMSISILLINVFMSHFFSRQENDDFFAIIEPWTVVGFNWAMIFKYSELESRAQAITLCSYFIFFYIGLFLFSSVYLAFGSISRESKCAVPWLYLQAISMIDQSVALAIRLKNAQPGESPLDVIFYSAYLLVNGYFWLIVRAAHKEWTKREANESNASASRISCSRPSPQSANEPPIKSPSFVSQTFSMLQPSAIIPKRDNDRSLHV